MKVRSNPKHSPAAVQYPMMPGLYIGAVVATVEDRDHKDFGKPLQPYQFKFSDEPVELLAEGESLHAFQMKHPHELAYLMRKVKDGELLAADAEMAKLCGVSLDAPAPKSAQVAEHGIDHAFDHS